MIGSENPYEPPATPEEPNEKGLDDEDALDQRSIAIALSLILSFVVSVVIIHSWSAELGSFAFNLAILFLLGFTAFTVTALIHLFKRF